jgi:hypothetical protein
MARLEIIVDGVPRFAEDVDSVAFTHHNWTKGDGGILELTAQMSQSKPIDHFVLGPSGTVVDGLMVAPTLGVDFVEPWTIVTDDDEVGE